MDLDLKLFGHRLVVLVSRSSLCIEINRRGLSVEVRPAAWPRCWSTERHSNGTVEAWAGRLHVALDERSRGATV